VVEKADKGDIVLMHDIYDFTADLCEIVIPKLVEKGFRIVSVSEMYEAYGKELKAGQVYYSVDFAEGNTLVVDQRAGGKSEGTTICFGIKEKYDCLEWIKYAIDRFGDIPIMLTGVSMGGATVLMASELDLPKNVKCIVSDCPYTSPYEIIALECEKMGIPAKLGMPFVCLGARIFGNLKLSGEGAEKAVRNTKVPILLVHGEDDDFVPFEMGKRIYEANPEMITFEAFPNAAHGISFIVDTERYEKLYYSLQEKYGT
jgi:pimeloyl-ACP methyl ester carboxylesterase